jgi:hypothetical protein
MKDEPLVFTQSDLETNVDLDTSGRLCLFDFESVGLLPESFAFYTVNMCMKPFVIEVASYLPFWTSPNLTSMARAGEILRMTGNLGLLILSNRRF